MNVYVDGILYKTVSIPINRSYHNLNFNAFTSCTNYLHRTHALRSTSHARIVRALTEPHSLARLRAFLCLSFLFFIAIVCTHAKFALVSTTSTTLQNDNRIHEHPRTHCICTPCAHASLGRLRNHHCITLGISLLRLSQSKPQVTLSNHNTLQNNYLCYTTSILEQT